MLKEVSINEIAIVSNYRKTFNEKSISELADSIKQNGVLEPIILRLKNGILELIAGERRLKACIKLGMVTIPALIKENVSDEDFFKFQMIENIQREGVPFMEEARGLADLRNKCDMDISEIATKIGKSDALIYNLLALTRMSAVATEAAENGELTKSVAVRIARLKSHQLQDQAATALRRKHKDKLVSDRFARKYFQTHFGERSLSKPRLNGIQKQQGNDYCANWKKYLVNFESDQFLIWKQIVNGRTDTDILAEAVESIMLQNQ